MSGKKSSGTKPAEQATGPERKARWFRVEGGSRYVGSLGYFKEGSAVRVPGDVLYEELAYGTDAWKRNNQATLIEIDAPVQAQSAPAQKGRVGPNDL